MAKNVETRIIPRVLLDSAELMKNAKPSSLFKHQGNMGKSYVDNSLRQDYQDASILMHQVVGAERF